MAFVGPITWPSGPKIAALIGMSPMNDMMNTAITRPRRWFGTADWIDVFTSEFVVSSAAPASAEIAIVSARDGDGERSEHGAEAIGSHHVSEQPPLQGTARETVDGRRDERFVYDGRQQHHVRHGEDSHERGAGDQHPHDVVLAGVPQPGSHSLPAGLAGRRGVVLLLPRADHP